MSSASIETLLKQALSFQENGKLQEARAVYQWILEDEPDHPVALHFTGVLAQQVGRYDIAERLIRRAIDVMPGYTEAHVSLALMLIDLQRFEEAQEACAHALALDSTHAPALYCMGNVLRALGRPEEAVHYYRASVAVKPDFADAWANLGDVLQSLGASMEAHVAYQKAAGK